MFLFASYNILFFKVKNIKVSLKDYVCIVLGCHTTNHGDWNSIRITKNRYFNMPSLLEKHQDASKKKKQTYYCMRQSLTSRYITQSIILNL